MSVNNSNYGQNRNLSASNNNVDFIKVQRNHQMSLSDKIDSFFEEVTQQVSFSVDFILKSKEKGLDSKFIIMLILMNVYDR